MMFCLLTFHARQSLSKQKYFKQAFYIAIDSKLWSLFMLLIIEKKTISIIFSSVNTWLKSSPERVSFGVFSLSIKSWLQVSIFWPLFQPFLFNKKACYFSRILFYFLCFHYSHFFQLFVYLKTRSQWIILLDIFVTDFMYRTI